MSENLIDLLKQEVREDLPGVFNITGTIHPKDQAVVDGILAELDACDGSFMDLSDLLVEKHNVYDFEDLYRMIGSIAAENGL